RIWRAITRLAEELRTLEPALVSPDATAQATVSDERIHSITKQGPDGLYVICINGHHEPVTGVEIKLPVATGTATVLFEDRQFTIQEGRVRDDFTGYERHVYRVVAR
ncbi:MAG: hypothetical protein H5T86_16950, partial [Armatimonadetes bacterium]|nr:hypothetical protein [Armatimonadota bacterium]